MNRIQTEVRERAITRLCHFTPSRNLAHIATGTTGVLATAHLEADERSVYTPSDLQRLDGYQNYISCSIEYPNGWFFDQAREQDVLFKDWVVLLLHRRLLWLPGTLFCQHNAAGNRGRDVRSGYEAFNSLFAAAVTGSQGRTFVRQVARLPCCPTDDQAEVLIPDRIDLAEILGIVVSSETQARNEAARFRYLGVDRSRFPIIISPAFFNKYELSAALRNGTRPNAVIWDDK